MTRLLFVVFALMTVGCSQQKMLEKFSTPAAQAEVKTYVANVQARNFGPIEANLDPKLKTADPRPALARMAAILPSGPPTSVKLVGAQTLQSPQGTQTNTTLEFRWGDKWFLCNVAILKTQTTRTMVGFNVTPEKTSLVSQNRFSLTGKSPGQYGVLAAAILAFCITFYALVACIRTRGLRRKWLWILFIVFGFGMINTNWSTGQMGFNLVYVSLFSASAFAPLYGVWTISASFPVGAVVFLWRRRRSSSAR